MELGPYDEAAQGIEKIAWLLAIPAFGIMSFGELASPDPDWVFGVSPAIIALGGIGRLMGWVNRGSGH